MENNTGIPILYYHSIANHSKDKDWSFLSIKIELFKKQIEYLHKKGYSTCNWQELDSHLSGKKKLPNKTVMFHFDDGFLDNWSVVFPIMEKVGFKYSIVITPDFIQSEGDIRPFVTETSESNKENWWGYLNRNEIEKMSDSGLVDFQAHGFTHTWYESSSKLIDICDEKNFYPHVAWNLQPNKKSHWLLNKLQAPIGFPVFEYKKSLELENRFLLNEEFIFKAINSYDETKTKDENLEKYNAIIASFEEENNLGRYESEEESTSRFIKELKTTKEFIYDITKKPVDYLVFPGGGSSKRVIDLCKEAGYKLISKGKELNTFGSNIYQIERYSAAYIFPVKYNIFLNVIFLRLQLKRAKGSLFVSKLFEILKK
jgi:peptidoglycan/xylan/chitin deacetylase (PgdA/CDA1 family)